jgi:hypothetical protein
MSMKRFLFLMAALTTAAMAQRINVVVEDSSSACVATLEKGLAGAGKVVVGATGLKNSQGVVDGADKWLTKKGKSDVVVLVASSADSASGGEEAFGENVTAIATKVKEAGGKLVVVLPEGASKQFATMATRLMEVQGMKAAGNCDEAVAAVKQALGK